MILPTIVVPKAQLLSIHSPFLWPYQGTPRGELSLDPAYHDALHKVSVEYEKDQH